MSRMPPENAKHIVDMRLRGFKPDELILVSMIGNLGELNHTVHARPGYEYDWRWVRDLRIVAYISRDVDWRKTVLAIAHNRPAYLAVWDKATQRGAKVYLKPSHPATEDKPADQWEWVLDFSNWQDCDNEDFAA